MNKNKRRTVVAQYDDAPESIRIYLPPKVWFGRREISTGIYRTGIYISRNGRVVEETDNIWQQQDGSTVGVQYLIVSQEEHLLSLADQFPEVQERFDELGICPPVEL